MSLKQEFTCDGCQKLSVNSMPNWLELLQPEKKSGRGAITIAKAKSFCGLECLLAWAEVAVRERKKIRKSVESLPGPHGGFISLEKGMEDMYF